MTVSRQCRDEWRPIRTCWIVLGLIHINQDFQSKESIVTACQCFFHLQRTAARPSRLISSSTPTQACCARQICLIMTREAVQSLDDLSLLSAAGLSLGSTTDSAFVHGATLHNETDSADVDLVEMFDYVHGCPHDHGCVTSGYDCTFEMATARNEVATHALVYSTVRSCCEADRIKVCEDARLSTMQRPLAPGSMKSILLLRSCLWHNGRYGLSLTLGFLWCCLVLRHLQFHEQLYPKGRRRV